MRIRAACTRPCCSQDSKDFTLHVADRRGVRLLPAGLRAPDPDAVGGLRRSCRPATRCARDLAGQIALLRAWDDRWSARLGGHLAGGVLGRAPCGTRPTQETSRRACRCLIRLRGRCGSTVTQLERAAREPPIGWRRTSAPGGVPWGEINRFQRINGDIVQPSTTPSPASRCPSPRHAGARSPSFGARRYAGHQALLRHVAATASSRWSSSADKVRAVAVTAGGESGDPALAALRRRGGTLRHGRAARGLLLPRGAAGPRRAHLPPGRVTTGRGRAPCALCSSAAAADSWCRTRARPAHDAMDRALYDRG